MISLSPLIRTFEAYDEVYSKFGEWPWVVAFSGGKDSSVVLYTLYLWLKERGIARRVYVLFNDTGSELKLLEDWVEEYVKFIGEKLREVGSELVFRRTLPDVGSLFVWRTVVRGYPAPTFNFRWCVSTLKIGPAKVSLREFDRAVLFTGLREDESSARAAALKRRSACTADMSCLSSFYVKTDMPGVVRVAPIRHWTLEDVWRHVKKWAAEEPVFRKLLQLYGFSWESKSLLYYLPVRYGCWHCTLVPVHHALELFKVLSNGNASGRVLDCYRRIIRAISDLKEMRVVYTEKPKGKYSTLGPLNACGRALILKMYLDLAGRGLLTPEVAKIVNILARSDYLTLKRFILMHDNTPRAREFLNMVADIRSGACSEEQKKALANLVAQRYPDCLGYLKELL